MQKKKRTVRYTAEQLENIVEREGTRSNWARAAKLSRRKIEAAAASDEEEKGMTVDWNKATIAMPMAKAVLNMRIDCDVLDYFRRQGRGYQTKINAVLRSYVEHAGRRRA